MTKKELNKYRRLMYEEFIKNHPSAFTEDQVYIYQIAGNKKSEYHNEYVILDYPSQANSNTAKQHGFTDNVTFQLLYVANRQTKTLTPNFGGVINVDN